MMTKNEFKKLISRVVFGLALAGLASMAPRTVSAAGKVAVMQPDAPLADYECDSVAQAFEYISSAAGDSYEVVISDDFTEMGLKGIADITVPATGKKVVIDAGGHDFMMGAKLNLAGDVTFRNVVIKPAKALAIKLGNNVLSFENVKVEGGIASVTGSGNGIDTTKFKSKFNLKDSDIVLNGKLTKVETVGIEDSSLISFGASSYYAVTTSGAAVLGGTGNFKYSKTGTLSSVKGNINIAGPLKKKGGTLELALYMKNKDGSYTDKTSTFEEELKNDATLAKTGILFGKMPNVTSEDFDMLFDAEGRFVKNAGSLYYGVMPGGYILSYEEDEQVKSSELTSFAGLVTEINSMKKLRDYKVLITVDAQEKSKATPDKLVGPTEKCASSLTISGGDYGAALYYTGKLTMKCPVVLDNIEFKLVNKGKAYGENDTPKAITTTFGNYAKVTERGARFNTPIKVAAKGRLCLDGPMETITAGVRNCIVGDVNAATIELSNCALDVDGKMSVRNIKFVNSDGLDAVHIGATKLFNVTGDIENELQAAEGDSIIILTTAKKMDEANKNIVASNLSLLGAYKKAEGSPDIYVGILETASFVEGQYRTPKTGDAIFKVKKMRGADIEHFKMLFENKGVLAGDQINVLTKHEADVVFAVKDLNVIYPEY